MALTQIEQGMLKDGILTADSAGRLKMADAFVNSAKMAAGAARANFGAGAVLQVVSGIYSNQVSNSSTTPISSGLTATITPSSTSSKILAIVSNPMRRSGGTVSGIGLYLYKNGSSIFNAMSNMGYSNPSTADISWLAAFSVLDSPASVSALTYTMYFSANAGTAYAQIDGAGNTGSIILLEIAG